MLAGRASPCSRAGERRTWPGSRHHLLRWVSEASTSYGDVVSVEDDDEVLEWVPAPVELLRFDVADRDEQRLQLFFDLVGEDSPGSTLAEVKVVETGERVLALLLRRELEGMLPDGSFHGSKFVNCLSCVQVTLRWPLGSRQVFDASTGQVVKRLDPAPKLDLEQGNLDHMLTALARDRGCPLWRVV